MHQPNDRLQPIPGPISLTPEWHAAHLKHLTASRAGGICNVSEYTTPYHIYAEMTGLVAPFEGNAATETGQIYEPAILADYCRVSGVQVEHPLPMFFHPTIPYLAATPDGQVAGNGTLVEAKWTLSPKRAAELGEEGSDRVPDDWMLQGQAQLDTMVATECDFAVLLYGRLKVYHVVRNDDLIELYHDAASELWQRIQDGRPPEPTWTHPKTPELIKALHGAVNDETVILSDATVDAWNTYRSLSMLAENAKKKAEAEKAKVIYAMGNANRGVLPSGQSELVRSVQNRKGYSVDATSFITLREKKVKQ